MYQYKSFSPTDTYNIACRLGKKLKGSEVIALEGSLGAGKTVFVKGLAAGLGAEGPVTSPTFTLLNLYSGRLVLAHFDVYRLPRPEAIEELGYEEYFFGPGVTAVEWSDLISAYLPEEYLLVKIERLPGSPHNEGRLIRFGPHGEGFAALIEELMNDDSPRD